MSPARHSYEGTEGSRRYSSNPFATSELEGDGESALLLGRFYPGKDSVSMAEDAGWPSEPLCTEWNVGTGDIFRK